MVVEASDDFASVNDVTSDTNAASNSLSAVAIVVVYFELQLWKHFFTRI